MNEKFKDRIIRMAWEDRTSFDEIKDKTGFTEADIIKLMRKELKASSFRMWRKRVTGRSTKHRKTFARDRQILARKKIDLPEDSPVRN